jgi:hypothetical protein
MHRIFVDEVGHDDFAGCEAPGLRYLGLTGVIMDLAYEQGEFTARMDRIKRDTFGTEKVVLHRREIMNHVGPYFTVLKDDIRRARFDAECIRLFEEADYTVITVVIHKAEHMQTYAKWRFHPYHYCMTCLLERYALWLSRRRLMGDVVFESRGKRQNKKLPKSYRRLYMRGIEEKRADDFQRSFTSCELKIQTKSANVAGLQLADLIASPLCRDLICRNRKEELKDGARSGYRNKNRTSYLNPSG